MRAFFGGQIKQECRGDLAAVIAKNRTSGEYDSFLYPTDSEEFIQLTGVRAVRCPVERVYIGISQSVGNELMKESNSKEFDKVNLRSLDVMVVNPYFLYTIPEKSKITPEQIESE
jgi:hypothetical protein